MNDDNSTAVRQFPFSIDSILEEARKDFKGLFGNYPSLPLIRDSFEESVLSVLGKKHEHDPYTLAEEVFDYLDNLGQELTNGVEGIDPSDYHKLIQLTALGLRDTPPNHKEVEFILFGEDCLREGDVIYHFSNKIHEVGFEGHEGMCFTGSRDIDSIVTSGIEWDETIYCHTFRVKDPSKISHHNMTGNDSELIEEFLIDKVDPRDLEKNWYTAIEPGAVECISYE